LRPAYNFGEGLSDGCPIKAVWRFKYRIRIEAIEPA